MPALLEAENIRKWVGAADGRADILKGVSLAIQPGEFLSIMGASGSGKSTLMHVLGLLDVPSAGSLRFAGQDTTPLSDDALAALRATAIGFIFQGFHLLPYLTVRENIALGLAYRPGPAPRARVDELLARVQLTHRATARPATLSGGEQQRVAIARALVHRPTLLLADEPTGSLDSASGTEILNLLTELHREGTTIVLVKHDASIARRAQRQCVMRDGRFE